MKEEIQFLKELQNELLAQEDDCQAAPRFWTVGDYRIVNCAEGRQDDYHIYLPKREYFDDVGDLLNEIELEEFHELSNEAIEEFREIDCEMSALEWIQRYYDEDAELIPVREEHFVRPDTMFLTKAEAKKHIGSNRHHYSPKAHTYAMTAWRAPKVERLLKILETLDWGKIEELVE